MSDSKILDAADTPVEPHVPAVLRMRPLDAREQRARIQRRALLIFAALFVILWLAFDQPLFGISAFFVALLELVPELWYHIGLRHVSMSRHIQYRSVEFGGTVEVELTVENRKLLPLPWLEITDEFPESLVVMERRLASSARIGRAALHLLLALAAYQRVRRRYQLLAVGRGVFKFGPTTISTSDPFGIMMAEGEQDTESTLIVHPLVISLERFGLPPGAPFGERSARASLLDDPLYIAGVRDYTPGDEPRRLHWKATARTGALQSKVYQPSTRHTLIVCINLRTSPYAMAAPDDALIELAISAAASVVAWAHEQRYTVGLFANGSLRMTSATVTGDHATEPGLHAAPRATRDQASYLNLAPSANPQRLASALDGLAHLLPFTLTPMDALLERERWRWPTGATVVYIGADTALDGPLLTLLRRVRSSGHNVSMLLTHGNKPIDDALTSLRRDGFAVHGIGDRAHWQALVADALGADLAQRLARGAKPAFISTSEAELVRSAGRHERSQERDGGGNGA